MRQLIDAQQEANRLHELARQEGRRSRIENTATKFPALKILDQNIIDDWYKQVLPMINSPKYRDFYDNRASDIIADGTHLPLLNKLLFNEIYRACSDPVREYILVQHHLSNDGIALLHNLTTTFATPWTTMQKENHLQKWLQLHQDKGEGIRDFFERCIKERQKLLNHGVPCDEDSLIHRFIMGLPPQFTSIQEKVDDLPTNWRVRNIHLLPGIAEAFLENKNNIRDMHRTHKETQNPQQQRPQPNTTAHPQQQQQQQQVQQQNPRPLDPVTQQRQDDIYAAIMSGAFDYHSFTSIVPQDICIYYGDSHPCGSMACSALRRIYNKAAARGTYNTPLDTLIRRTPATISQTYQQQNQQWQHRPQPNPPTRQTPVPQPPPRTQQQQLLIQRQQPTQSATRAQNPAQTQQRVTFQQSTASNVIIENHEHAQSLEEISPDELHDTVLNMIQDNSDHSQVDNHNNETLHDYPFCANTSIILTNSAHCNLHSYTKLLIDSGASHTMINDKRLFTTLHNLESGLKFATLADGITKTPILGYGNISGFTSDGHYITIDNCLFIPTLSSSLL